MYVKPMLAQPMSAKSNIGPGWVAEEKYDGHRLCIEVNKGQIEARTRNENLRQLPGHVVKDLAQLPNGIYDGELISTAKTKSYGVTELVQADKLQAVIFDVIELQLVIDGKSARRDVRACTYEERRAMLETIFNGVLYEAGMSLSVAYPITSLEDVADIARVIWDRGGEGLVLKRKDSQYESGRRSPAWIKIKQLHNAVLEVKGWIAGLLGPFAIVLLEDEDGNQVTVKTLNTKERQRAANARDHFIGRKLCIEFQERTPDGGYRHPMWDHWKE